MKNIKSELSPLDQIRYAEAEVIRSVAQARDEAMEIENRARRQARQLMIQARERGKNEGEARRKEMLNIAEEEANAIIAQAKNQSVELRRRGYNQMNSAVNQLARLICGLDHNEEES